MTPLHRVRALSRVRSFRGMCAATFRGGVGRLRDCGPPYAATPAWTPAHVDGRRWREGRRLEPCPPHLPQCATDGARRRAAVAGPRRGRNWNHYSCRELATADGDSGGCHKLAGSFVLQRSDRAGASMESPIPAAPADSRSVFLEEKAFKSRTVLIFGTITDVTAAEAARRLIALDADSSEPIDVIVSSPGGHLESGDTIHDLVRFVRAPIRMIGSGWVGSAATHVYLAAPRERRFCLPNTRFLIHQPSGGAGGSASDIEIQARELVRARERIAGVIARETGRSLASVLADIDRDRWMSAEEAIEYGLVSKIITQQGELLG